MEQNTILQKMNEKKRKKKAYINLKRYPIIVLCVFGAILYIESKNILTMVIPVLIGIGFYIYFTLRYTQLMDSFYQDWISLLLKSNPSEMNLVSEKKEIEMCRESIQNQATVLFHADHIQGFTLLQYQNIYLSHFEGTRYTGNGNLTVFQGYSMEIPWEEIIPPLILDIKKYAKKYPDDKFIGHHSEVVKICVLKQKVVVYFHFPEDALFSCHYFDEASLEKANIFLHLLLNLMETLPHDVEQFLRERRIEEE